jgi:hypothetical protein
MSLNLFLRDSAVGGDTMKKLLVLAALVAVAFMPTTAQAGPIGGDGVMVGDIISLTDWYNTHQGGPFVVDNQTFGSPDGWFTFCVESEGSVDLGQPVFLVAGISESVTPSGIPLVPQVAYLYTKYRAMGGSMDIATNNDYQNAIGYFMGGGGGYNALVDEANAAILLGGAWYGMGLANVAVMNLVYSEDYGIHSKGDNAQDMLTMVPDGGATLTLLGCALLGLGALRRKFSA